MMNTSNINPAEIADTRRRLVLAGYKIVPVNGKNPGITGWQNINAEPEDAQRWQTMYPHHNNTGVLAKRTPGIDIDILISEAADNIEALARDRFGSRGKFLLRFGKHPKRAIPFRTDTPFKKITTPQMIAPNGDENQKVEILGDGQQFVVHGIHPDTHNPYSWTGGELWTTQYGHLPHIREKDAREFVEAAARVLLDHGYRLKAPAKGNGCERGDHHSGDDPRADMETLREALSHIPNNASWDEWNNIGMALWRAANGSEAGFLLFDEWSQRWSG
jgi:hypothetical protein